jgi:hypothetical protein
MRLCLVWSRRCASSAGHGDVLLGQEEVSDVEALGAKMRLCASTLSKQSRQPPIPRRLDGWPSVEVTSDEQHLGRQLLGEQDQVR